MIKAEILNYFIAVQVSDPFVYEVPMSAADYWQIVLLIAIGFGYLSLAVFYYFVFYIVYKLYKRARKW